MSLARPVVGVYDAESPGKVVGSVVMPTVMEAPIRPDMVNFVHANLAKNHRQAYGVQDNAGYQTSAESWGTGRAVARIPRVAGGGTHRAGQAAFGNMCRGGGMFAPNKVWRRWHRKVNLTQRRHAVASAIAGSAFTGLVFGRGHRINDIPELPLVVSDSVESFKKTKQAVAFLSKIGCDEDLERVDASKKIRAGRGKSRNRRYVLRKGPLIVYADDNGITRAFNNIPGVDICSVDRLNLMKLAPGGSVGRLIIWSEGAFKKLQSLYGDYTNGSEMKKNYVLHRPVMTNADLSRIINSAEIQSQLNKPKKGTPRSRRNQNPLRNHAVRCRLNPAHKQLKFRRQCAAAPGTILNKVIQKKKAETLATTKLYRKNVAKFNKALAALGSSA